MQFKNLILVTTDFTYGKDLLIKKKHELIKKIVENNNNVIKQESIKQELIKYLDSFFIISSRSYTHEWIYYLYNPKIYCVMMHGIDNITLLNYNVEKSPTDNEITTRNPNEINTRTINEVVEQYLKKITDIKKSKSESGSDKELLFTLLDISQDINSKSKELDQTLYNEINSSNIQRITTANMSSDKPYAELENAILQVPRDKKNIDSEVAILQNCKNSKSIYIYKNNDIMFDNNISKNNMADNKKPKGKIFKHVINNIVKILTAAMDNYLSLLKTTTTINKVIYGIVGNQNNISIDDELFSESILQTYKDAENPVKEAVDNHFKDDYSRAINEKHLFIYDGHNYVKFVPNDEDVTRNRNYIDNYLDELNKFITGYTILNEKYIDIMSTNRNTILCALTQAFDGIVLTNLTLKTNTHAWEKCSFMKSKDIYLLDLNKYIFTKIMYVRRYSIELITSENSKENSKKNINCDIIKETTAKAPPDYEIIACIIYLNKPLHTNTNEPIDENKIKYSLYKIGKAHTNLNTHSVTDTLFSIKDIKNMLLPMQNGNGYTISPRKSLKNKKIYSRKSSKTKRSSKNKPKALKAKPSTKRKSKTHKAKRSKRSKSKNTSRKLTQRKKKTNN